MTEEIKTPSTDANSGWLIERTSIWGTEWFCAGKKRWTKESCKAIRLPDRDSAIEMWQNWKIACGNKPVTFPYKEEGGGAWEYSYDVTEHIWLSEPCHHALDLARVTQERDALRGALDELCRLKALKDSLGKTPEYLRDQPIAWQRAIRALKTEGT